MYKRPEQGPTFSQYDHHTLEIIMIFLLFIIIGD